MIDYNFIVQLLKDGKKVTEKVVRSKSKHNAVINVVGQNKGLDFDSVTAYKVKVSWKLDE